MGKKNRVLEETEVLLNKKIGQEKCRIVMKYAWDRFEELKLENKDDSDALKKHTERQILPAISMYEGLIKAEFEKENAVDILDECFKTRAERPAQKIRNLLKIPGLYHIIPNVFKKAVVKMFGEDAGFSIKFYPTDKNRAKFDMLKCPYYEKCKKYGYPEITRCFCHTDDVAYGNMHKKLIWNRTKTIGLGQDFCDFDIFIDNKNK